MFLKVLVDNNTYIDKYYIGEPAVSYYIEADGRKILFDTGYSDVFLKNGQAMEIKFEQLDFVVLSHGHNDHTGGLHKLIREIEGKGANITLVSHPGIFDEKFADGIKISPDISKEEVSKSFPLILTKQVYPVTKHLIFLGEIPRENDFEGKSPVGFRATKHGLKEDYVSDDSALVYQTTDGIYIITGCSHAGICNIIEYAKKITGEERVLGILGGFHLFDINEQTEKTVAYLQKFPVKELYPCHCTSLKVKAELMKKMRVYEVGVGLELNW